VFGVFVTHPEKSFLLAEPGKLDNFAVSAADGTRTFVPRSIRLLGGLCFFCHSYPPQVMEKESL
jgi:hypothetical protein